MGEAVRDLIVDEAASAFRESLFSCCGRFMANAGKHNQPDLFTGIIPPDHALVRAPPRQARARDPSKVVDVEVVTPAAKNATNEKVVDPIVAVEATAKFENAIVVSPPAPAPAPTPSPAERTLPTTQQHIEAISDQLRIFRAGYDLRHRVEVDERGALKSDLQIKKRIWGLSRNKTIVAVVSLAVVTAAAGLGSTHSAWLPRLKSKLWPPTVVKPVRNGEMYGPPVPKHLLGRRQPKREPKPPPSLFEQIFGK